VIVISFWIEINYYPVIEVEVASDALDHTGLVPTRVIGRKA